MINSPTLFIIFLVFQLASSIFLTPLEVLSTRLSIQRNSYSPYAVASQHESGMGAAGAVLPDGVGWAGVEEDVIGLRPEEEPYEGSVVVTLMLCKEFALAHNDVLRGTQLCRRREKDCRRGRCSCPVASLVVDGLGQRPLGILVKTSRLVTDTRSQ